MDNFPIRIAQIMGKWIGGGVETVVMNYYRQIDRSKIQFDFICDNDSTNIPYDEIKRLGGKIILIPPYQKEFKYQKELKRVLKEEKYKIVHSHINTLSVFSLYAAKKAGIPVRIAHAHSTSNKIEWKKNLIKIALRPLIKLFATDYMACSEYAGRWMFGNKEFEKGKVFILNNAIDLNKFKYDETIRRTKREELNIYDDTFVIGHVGRFVKQKNHKFLIDVFNEVHKKIDNSKLLLVGQGPLQKEIEKKVYKLGLADSVIFLGQRDDVNMLMQAMDYFVFPSLYEGLGIVAIEAQCSGLNVLCSSNVPDEAKVTELFEICNIRDASKWKEIILTKKNIRKDYSSEIKNSNFEIKNEAKKLQRKYLEMETKNEYN